MSAGGSRRHQNWRPRRVSLEGVCGPTLRTAASGDCLSPSRRPHRSAESTSVWRVGQVGVWGRLRRSIPKRQPSCPDVGPGAYRRTPLVPRPSLDYRPHADTSGTMGEYAHLAQRLKYNGAPDSPWRPNNPLMALPDPTGFWQFWVMRVGNDGKSGTWSDA